MYLVIWTCMMQMHINPVSTFQFRARILLDFAYYFFTMSKTYYAYAAFRVPTTSGIDILEFIIVYNFNFCIYELFQFFLVFWFFIRVQLNSMVSGYTGLTFFRFSYFKICLQIFYVDCTLNPQVKKKILLDTIVLWNTGWLKVFTFYSIYSSIFYTKTFD